MNKYLKRFVLCLMLCLVGVAAGCDMDTESQKYKVEYDDLNGNIYEIYVEEGDLLVEYTPSKEGYVFAGWYTDKDLTRKYNFKNGVIKDLQLYAKYKVVYEVKYDDLNGNVFVDTVAEGEELKPYTPVKENFAFIGWYTDKELTVEYDTTQTISSDIVLYAKFEEAKYTVTYDDINGKEYVENIAEGAKAKEYIPSKVGYAFEGWYIDKELTIKYDFNQEVTENLKLYGKYVADQSLETISDKQIFDMEEEAYYIFFVKDTCPYCEKTRPTVIEYNNTIASDPLKYKDNYKVYQVYLSLDGVKSKISRAYPNVSGNGQGTKGNYFVDGVTKWDDLYIGSAPSLILIKEVNGVKTAQYIAQNGNDVPNYLKNLLKDE